MKANTKQKETKISKIKADVARFVKRNKLLTLIVTTVALVLLIPLIVGIARERLLSMAGVTVGMLIIGGAWVVTMIVYYKLRKAMYNSKYGVEIIFVAGVLLIGAVIFMHYYCFENQDSSSAFVTGIESFFSGIYSAIGKLMFEGMDDLSGKVIIPLFYGWALYAGITFLSIITMKASYEFFSLIRLITPESNRDVFVFTALTEETLQIAKSIEEHYANKNEGCEKDSKKKRKKQLGCKIVFAGTALEPFDRKDDLCREVMAHNYAYWSFTNNRADNGKKKNKSFAEMLYLYNNNFGKYNRRFVIFAFETEKHIPCEENNMNMVFSDIETRIENEDDKMRIEYYILTKRNINYEAYDYKNRELMFKYYKQKVNSLDKSEEQGFKTYLLSSKVDQEDPQNVYKSTLKKLNENYFDRFVINVWSEATAISKKVADRATEFLVEKMCAWEESGLPSVTSELSNPNQEPTYDLKIWCLGFGPTAQAIAKALYCQSAYIDQEGNASLVKIEAFDKKIEKVSGLFRKEQPLGIYLEENEGCEKINQQRKKLNEERYLCEKRFDKSDKEALFSRDDKLFDLANKEMAYPIYQFYDADCRSSKFMDSFDRAIGKKAGTKQIPDIFVIATGDDYNNIRVANAIIQDTINENHLAGESWQLLFINVWDESNNDLVLTCGGEWDDSHTQLTINQVKLKVFLVGNNSEIYSSDIIEVKEPSRYNENYNQIGDVINNSFKKELQEEEKTFAKDFKNRKDKYLFYGKTEATNDELDIALRYWFDCIIEGVVNNMEIEEPKLPISASKKEDEKSAEEKKLEKEQRIKQKVYSILPDSIKNANNSENDDENAVKQYNMLNIWLKESNVQAKAYQKVYRKLEECQAQNNKNESKDDATRNKEFFTKYHRLSMFEHQRWNRAHIVAGWDYKPLTNKRELSKQHQSILPYKFVGADYLYDTVNVLMIEKR